MLGAKCWGDSSEWGRHGPNPYGAENLAALYVCNTGPWKGSCWQRPRVSSHLNGRLSTSETCPPVSFLITSSLPLSLPAKWLPILSSFLPLLAWELPKGRIPLHLAQHSVWSTVPKAHSSSDDPWWATWGVSSWGCRERCSPEIWRLVGRKTNTNPFIGMWCILRGRNCAQAQKEGMLGKVRKKE